jgi:hypothetical protein
MAAAAITPTWVQRRDITTTSTYGTTAGRVVEYLVKLTKVAQSDWIVAATYCPGTLVSVTGWTIDGSTTTDKPETISYTVSGTKLIMGVDIVGTTYLKVTCVL